jgi:Fe-S cluster biogenesis protein NfuA
LEKNIKMQKLPITVYAESTPNPNTMMFGTNISLAPGNITLEFTDKSQTKGAPLASELFQMPFVTRVFISNNFVTVTKNDLISWQDVVLDVREYIQQFLQEGKQAVTAVVQNQETVSPKANVNQESYISAPANHQRPINEIEERIVEILEEYIRPAVEGDGGAIHFKSFEDGKVTVVLRGSCSGCPSSTITLKNGIENLMTRMIPEVKEVVAES